MKKQPLGPWIIAMLGIPVAALILYGLFSFDYYVWALQHPSAPWWTYLFK